MNGRKHDLEWSMMLERVGEVAGAEALAELSAGTTPNARSNTSRCLEGWAGVNPEAAFAWFKAQPPEFQDAHWNGFFQGLGRSDPQKATRLAMTQDQQTWEPTMDSVIAGAFERGGFGAAERLIDDVMGLTDADYRFKRKVVYSVGQRRLEAARLSGDAFAPLTWFDRFMQPDSPIGPIITREVVSMAAKSDAHQAMLWLDQRELRMTGEQSDAAYRTAAVALQQQAPEEMARWIANHPTHRNRAAILDALAQQAATSTK